MKSIGIIPARFASTRFPGKPLALIHGKSMIRRVYERACQSTKLTTVIVATDDIRIFDHVKAFGGKVVMTDESHESGTERCAEALEHAGEAFDVVVNVQGDEPYIHPGQIDLLVGCFEHPATQIATLVKVVNDVADLQNVNLPKVVVDVNGEALLFSRQAIPYTKPDQAMHWLQRGLFHKHIGIYGYRAETLKKLVLLSKGNLESAESLEQLRWLEHGYRIKTAVSNHENLAVDIPEDVKAIEKFFPAD